MQRPVPASSRPVPDAHTGTNAPKGAVETETIEVMRSMKNSMDVQNAALTTLMTTQTKSEGRHSTIQIKPQMKMPVLGDDGPDSREIKEFFDKVEDACLLAND